MRIRDVTRNLIGSAELSNTRNIARDSTFAQCKTAAFGVHMQPWNNIR